MSKRERKIISNLRTSFQLREKFANCKFDARPNVPKTIGLSSQRIFTSEHLIDVNGSPNTYPVPLIIPIGSPHSLGGIGVSASTMSKEVVSLLFESKVVLDNLKVDCTGVSADKTKGIRQDVTTMRMITVARLRVTKGSRGKEWSAIAVVRCRRALTLLSWWCVSEERAGALPHESFIQ